MCVISDCWFERIDFITKMKRSDDIIPEQLIYVKSIEMINYGSNINNRRLDQVGILTEISDEQAKELKGKIMIKDRDT